MSPAKTGKAAHHFDLLTPEEVRAHILSRLDVRGSGHTLFCACSTRVCGSICGSVPAAWVPHPKASVALVELVRLRLVERAGAYLWLHPSAVPAKLGAHRGVAQR